MVEDSFVISLPALIALTIKGGIFWYALKHPMQNLASRLFFYFLAALTAVNITEISGFYILIDEHRVPVLNGYLYYVFVGAALAVLFHLVTVLALQTRWPRLVRFVYGYYGILVVLLLATDWVVADFKRYAYAIIREPGPLYALFEVYALSLYTSVIGLLVYGGRKQRTAAQRLRNRWMLIAILPMCLVVGSVLVLLHLGVQLPFNTNFINPLAISYFLLVSSYAIYQHRLFDLQFFVPWSRTRRRKTAFYNRIRTLVAEIADLGSPDRIVSSLADCFACPVALMDGKTVTSRNETAQTMTRIPASVLQELKEIVVTDEIRDARPSLYASLSNLGIAAVVPFNSYNEDSDGWLLLGNSFSDRIYSRLDFDVVETLFARLADEFLEQQLAQRGNVSNLRRSLDRARERETRLQQELTQLRQQQAAQLEVIARLQNQLPIGTNVSTQTVRKVMGLPRITFIGKLKSLRSLVTRTYPRASCYFGPASAGFRSQPLPNVLVVDVDGLSERATEDIAHLISSHKSSMATMLHGQRAERFVHEHRDGLTGTMIERVPMDASDEYILAHLGGLAHLAQTTLAIIGGGYPVIAASRAMEEFIAQCKPVLHAGHLLLLVADEFSEALSLVQYLANSVNGHSQIESCTAREMVDLPATDRATRLAATAGDVTLLISDFEAITPAERSTLLRQCLMNRGHIVFTAGSNGPVSPDVEILAVPTLQQRAEDIPLLIHFFTLQRNLLADVPANLSKSQVDEMMRAEAPATVEQLKLAVLRWLERSTGGSETTFPIPPENIAASGRTLDDYLADTEIEVLKQTLKRCRGNKAQAAAMLGLKPNTLHYKLKRYGLLDYS